MSKKIFLTSAALIVLLLFSGNSPAATTEREPNDTPQQATLISDRVSGVWNVNDQDWFKLNLPRPGKVTATVTRFPRRLQYPGDRREGINGSRHGHRDGNLQRPRR